MTKTLAMMRDYLSQIEQTIAATSGRCLLLGPRENIDANLPASVTSVTEWHQYPEIDGVFDTLLSIENLASSQDISNMLSHFFCLHILSRYCYFAIKLQRLLRTLIRAERISQDQCGVTAGQ